MDMDNEATIPVPRAAALLGISRGSAYKAVRAGEIPAVKIGKRLLVPRRALERLLDGQPACAEEKR
jgi:excisionase family DNA binding protein